MHPGDAQTLALLTVLYAERNQIEDASRAQAALSALLSPPADLLAAANHALGLADSARGDDAPAVPCLQAAAGAAMDAREIVALRFLIAACWTRLHKKASALIELETIRHFRLATKDEKKTPGSRKKPSPPPRTDYSNARKAQVL